MEEARTNNFFQLLQLSWERRIEVSSKEWMLTTYCLDELNNRFADVAFLTGFTLAMILQASHRRRIRKWLLAVYSGLVLSDFSLQRKQMAPASEYWAAVTSLDTNLGRAARRIYTPTYRFADAPSIETTKTFLQMGSDSLLLRTWLPTIFQNSAWKKTVPSGSMVSSLAISSRFFTWHILSISADGPSMSLSAPKPVIRPDASLIQSYRCRESFMPYLTLSQKWWYNVQFAVLKLLGY